MKENFSEQVDDLFLQIRLCLTRVKQSDPVTADELKGLLTQLEDMVESLVVDSLKLKSLKSHPNKETKPVKSRQKRQ